MKKTLASLVLTLAFPALAHAGPVTMVARDVPLDGRALQAVAPPMTFNMIGLHWQGTGSVLYRVRTAGTWTAWQTADDDTQPDRASSEWQAGWHDGSPAWLGTSTGVQYRTVGKITRLRAYYLFTKTTSAPDRSLSFAGSPTIVPRSQWQADEKIVRAKPVYAAKLQLAVVHHTDSTNTYTQAEAPAIVRGIEIYHVQGNGWNDIGYNFLIDRFGTIYEGRAGGITRNVVGAHAQGFNTGSVGVSLIGTFDTATPPPAMQAALVKLLSWRLDLAHIDPLSTVKFTSGGNYKFKAGKVVTLRAISGHRDTGPTDCPGGAAYALLPAIAKEVAATGLPKLYAPLETGKTGGTLHFTGTLSSAKRWTITVKSTAGKVVATHSATSATIDWTWSAAGQKGPLTWSIAGPDGMLGAQGKVGGSQTTVAPVTPPATTPVIPTPVTPAPAALLSGLSASPSVLTVVPGTTSLATTVDFTLSAAATVVAQVVSEANPAAAPLKLLTAKVPAGANTFQWDLGSLPDGRYDLQVIATTSDGTTVTLTTPVTIDRTLSAFAATPATFSPNGDGTNDTVAFTFTVATSVPVQLTIQRAGAPVATVFAGQLGPGPQTVSWDGTSAGVRVPDGQYTAVVTATDALGTVSLLQTLTIDTTPPSLVVVDPSSLKFTLSEAAVVTAVVNGTTITVNAPAGTVTIPWSSGPVTSFTVSARDGAGNTSATLSGP